MDGVSGNPYRPGMGTVPTYLADRDGQLDRFQGYLRDFSGLPHNIRVTGLRGVGKTVLLTEYAEVARRWAGFARRASGGGAQLYGEDV